MWILSLVLLILNASCSILSAVNEHLVTTSSKQTNTHQVKLRHQDIWPEVNDSIVLNCSLKVNRDQHVVWHRKYDKMGVHVLTIESETFISDLRIRPIKQIFKPHSDAANNSFIMNNDLPFYDSQQNFKLTWNLEIRKLKKEDTAFYYCVLNSENAYGQIYKLNVMPHLTMLNKSEVSIDKYLEERTIEPFRLMCQYNVVSKSANEQIRWYFNKYRIRSSSERRIRISDSNSTKLAAGDFEITESRNNETSMTISTLSIKNLYLKSHSLIGRYKCQVKGLYKSTRIYSKNYQRFNDSIFLIQQQQQHHQQHLNDDKGFLSVQPPPSYSSASSSVYKSSHVYFIITSIPQFLALVFILAFNFALIVLLKQIITMQHSF